MSGLGWFGIVRLGLVQAAIGAMVMLATSLLNRVAVVEYALPAAFPAGLVAWHYAVQLSRPVWGHGSDRGARRTRWIMIGMGLLAMGVLLALDAVLLSAQSFAAGLALGILAFSLIGAGVGAAGTSLLALLAASVAPERRPAAAATTWIMMVAGIALSAGAAGALLDPFSTQRLALVVSGTVFAAFALALVAVQGVEKPRGFAPEADVTLGDALRDVAADPAARRLTLFVFVSMLAYSMQDLILEPFAGLRFAMSPAQSTQLSGVQHGGVMLGMIAMGVGGGRLTRRGLAGPELFVTVGCLGSAVALAGLALASVAGPGWPLVANVFALGLMNGVFAVAAVGAMMSLAGEARAGVRMGVWGAAQAIAFGLGGLAGATIVDVTRASLGDAAAFQLAFGGEAALFVLAAIIAVRVAPRRFTMGAIGA